MCPWIHWSLLAEGTLLIGNHLLVQTAAGVTLRAGHVCVPIINVRVNYTGCKGKGRGINVAVQRQQGHPHTLDDARNVGSKTLVLKLHSFSTCVQIQDSHYETTLKAQEEKVPQNLVHNTTTEPRLTETCAESSAKQESNHRCRAAVDIPMGGPGRGSGTGLCGRHEMHGRAGPDLRQYGRKRS